MQGQQNNIVKQQLIKELREFASKQTMIQYYMSYDFPEKQRGVKGWWQELIQNIIKKKNQIYVTFKDLQSISNINGMKPLPIKCVLKQLKKEFIFIKEEDITQQKKPQKKQKSWLSNIISFAWSKNEKNEIDFPFTFEPDEKIISSKVKENKTKQFLNFLKKQFSHQHSRFLSDFKHKASWALKIDEPSIQLIVKQLSIKKELALTFAQNFNDHILIFNQDRRKLLDQNFVKIEKIKCLLRGSFKEFQDLFEKSSNKILTLTSKAKEALLNNDKNKAKIVVAQIRNEEKHREKIETHFQLLQRRISEIEVNEMNKSSIDLLEEAQNAYKQVAVDPQKFEEVLQKERQIQMSSEQANKRFQELASSEEIEDEVDNLMKQIEEQVSSKKKVESQKIKVELLRQKNQAQGRKLQENKI